MGCGCNKGGRRSRGIPLRPSANGVSAQATRFQRGQRQSAAPNPAELRALGLQSSQTPGQARRMDAQRRRIEKLRRDAIKRRLGK